MKKVLLILSVIISFAVIAYAYLFITGKFRFVNANETIRFKIGSVDENGKGHIDNSLFHCNDSLILKYLFFENIENKDYSDLCLMPYFDILDNSNTIWWNVWKKYDLEISIINRQTKKIYRNLLYSVKEEDGNLFLTLAVDKKKIAIEPIPICGNEEVPNCSVK